MNNSLVSVVMPSFNQAEFIEESVRSVFDQTYGNVELIIFDGQSTDATCDKLEELQREYHRLTWVSEPDDGPADAINKAFSSARGEIIGWLNSDDSILRPVLWRARSTHSPPIRIGSCPTGTVSTSISMASGLERIRRLNPTLVWPGSNRAASFVSQPPFLRHPCSR